METRVYVGNLNKSTTQDEIKTLFAQAGTVTSVDVAKDKGTGASRGFAFVAMPVIFPNDWRGQAKLKAPSGMPTARGRV